MGRANVIVVGSAVLAPLILGVEAFALFRPHHRPPPPVVPPPAAQAEPAPAPPAAPEPTTAEEPAEAAADPATLVRYRDLLLNRRQVVRDADERVFDTLNLPESQRAAIRAIDDQYARTLESMAPTGVGGAGVDLNAEQTRRAAITNVLGSEVIHTFTNQERRAERRVRSELRAQALRGQ